MALLCAAILDNSSTALAFRRVWGGCVGGGSGCLLLWVWAGCGSGCTWVKVAEGVGRSVGGASGCQ
eukprot:4110812-Prorocentrum_lima.AAC.1